MRVAHVVTYISSDGAFGGPVRVAQGQASALAARGHQVTIFAASPDEVPRTIEQDGYVLRTFPARWVHRGLGFAGMYAPGLTKALKRQLPDLEVVHVHLARDLVTLPAARATRKSGTRLIAQPHGMIDKSSNILAGPIDAWEVRPALKSAAAVLTLTDQEMVDIAEVAPGATLQPIGNGIRPGPLPDYGDRDGGIVFLARLHPRKRPLAFVEMANLLIERGVTADFVLAGPDEGEGDNVRAAIAASLAPDRIRWIGPVIPTQTDELLRRAQVFVLPSVGEIFPMTILEAFSTGTPVVTTDSLGIALKCREYGAAAVTDGSASALAEAVAAIVADAEYAHALRDGAMRYVLRELSIDAVADTLLKVYGAVGATQR